MRSATALWVTLFGSALITALVLRLSALNPEGILAPETYGGVFAVHRSFALSLTNAAQLLLLALLAPFNAKDTRLELLFVGSAGLVGLQAIGIPLLAGLEAPSVFRYALSLVPLLALAVCLVAGASRIRRRQGFAAVVLLLTAVATLSASYTRDELTFILCVLVLTSSSSGRAVLPSRTEVVIAMAALLAFREWVPGAFVLLALVSGASFLWLAGVLWMRVDDRAHPSVRLLAQTGTAVVGAGVTLRTSQVLLSDTFLGDTLFAVASYHAWTVGEGFLVFASLLRVVEPLTGAAARWARIGISVAAVGTVGFVVLFARLGSLGMPRRYADYLPEFAASQRAATVAALLLVSGFGLTVYALWSRSRIASLGKSRWIDGPDPSDRRGKR